MSEIAADHLRRRARWVVRVQALCLLLAVLPGLISFAAPLNPNPVTLWCAQWGWLLFLAGGAGFAMAQLLSRWAFRCLSCRFRFARAGASNIHFLLRPSVIRFCPHCGTTLDASVAR